jgi:hypothetical protein
MTSPDSTRPPLPPAPAVPGLWRAIAGWAVWVAALTVLYAGHSLACRYTGVSGPAPLPPAGVAGWLLALWGALILANALLAMQSWRVLRRWRHCANRTPERARFMVRLTFILDATSLVATVVIGLPVAMLPACVP